MRPGFRGTFLVIFLVVLLATGAPALAAGGLTVSAGMTGSTVTISGNTAPSSNISIQINDPRDNVVFVGQATSDSQGNFGDSFTLPVGAVNGTYTLYAVAAAPGGPVSGSAVFTVQQAQQPVTVNAVNGLGGITVPYGTALADVGLPATAGITLSNGARPTVNVTWNGGSPAYNGSIAGNYTFSGTLALPCGVTNPSNLTASVIVTVANASPNNNPGGGSTGGGGGGGGGGGSSAAAVTTTSYNASVSGTDASGKEVPKSVIDITVNSINASMKIGSEQSNTIMAGGAVVVTVPSIPNVTAYTVGLPAASLSNTAGRGSLTLQTNAGSMVLPANMLANTGAAGKTAELSIAAGDKAALPEAVKAAIGNRPLVQLALKIDGKEVSWNNPAAPVAVSIPYTPTAAELASPESIVIWCIDGSGHAVSVPNGHYDAASGTVTFTTTHFSKYAVGYNRVSFKDVAASDWHSQAVGFIAARKITTGTGNGNYSPNAKLTRGEFIVMLLRAYDIAPDANPKDNFADAGNTYYTNYLAAAKRLGISEGVGNNMFSPGKQITRQEMFTLLCNALKTIGQLPQGKEGKDLTAFSDGADIAFWAKDAMTLLVKTGTVGGSGGKLSPAATTTRAEMAQVLYKLLAK